MIARLPTNKRNAPKRSILGLVYQIQETRHEQGLRETGDGVHRVTADHAPIPPAAEVTEIWRRNKEVREYVIENEGLLFHPVVQLLCHLNETAMFIWRNCDGLHSEALASRLAEHFRVEIETARRHVAKVLELFSVSGFVATYPLQGITE